MGSRAPGVARCVACARRTLSLSPGSPSLEEETRRLRLPERLSLSPAHPGPAKSVAGGAQDRGLESPGALSQISFCREGLAKESAF